MKNQVSSKNSFFAALFFLASAPAFGQNMDYQNTLSFSAGVHLGSLLNGADANIKADNEGDRLTIGTVKISSLPTFQLAYDHAVKKWFSIGGGVAFGQLTKFKTTDFSFTSADSSTVVKGNLDLAIRRTTLQVRPLFHYANDGKLDMYSGVRLGFSIWSVKPSGDVAGKFKDIEKDVKFPSILRFSGVVPNVQLTLFGLRGYLTDNVSAGFELSIGGPYFASGQVAYRF